MEETKGKVQSLLGWYQVSVEAFKNLNREEREKVLKVLAFHICNSQESVDFFWESLTLGQLVCVINEQEIKLENPYYSEENYEKLLLALHFFQYKSYITRTYH